MNLRNQQPTINQPTLFSSRNQMPNQNFGFQPNVGFQPYFQTPSGGYNFNQPIWNQNTSMGMQPMALQKALLDKTALWKFKNSRNQVIGD